MREFVLSIGIKSIPFQNTIKVYKDGHYLNFDIVSNSNQIVYSDKDHLSFHKCIEKICEKAEYISVFANKKDFIFKFIMSLGELNSPTGENTLRERIHFINSYPIEAKEKASDLHSETIKMIFEIECYFFEITTPKIFATKISNDAKNFYKFFKGER